MAMQRNLRFLESNIEVCKDEGTWYLGFALKYFGKKTD